MGADDAIRRTTMAAAEADVEDGGLATAGAYPDRILKEPIDGTFEANEPLRSQAAS
jgi:hypothetical protein